MADTPAQVAAGPVPELGGGPASGSWFSPCQCHLMVLGCGRAVRHPFPFTEAVVLFVMVIVQYGVNWVNERIVHY